MIICLYVDDLLVTGSNLKEIDEFKKMMEVEFEMTDLGRLSYFLGMEFTHTATGLLMHQQKYVKELLERFKMIKCNDARSPLEVNIKLRIDETEEGVNEKTYKQIVRSLRFLCNSRPNLMFSVGLISRFMGNPKKSHMSAAKRVLRYIKGTTSYGILFPYGMEKNELKLVGYADSDYGDQVERKTGCYVVCQGIWLNKVLKELRIHEEGSVVLKMDNTSAINLAKNLEDFRYNSVGSIEERVYRGDISTNDI
ncbi:uncharacterized mitochondrial protein AtMg00810-like [Vigna umbellata]|uniref:uncharacterized mitochondrial protein AtMg00810-like n=1 Tax=Vigna umbellata TaxID=87088 RepID=UPI001F5FCC10|nr:uncharacterized mitochondrial protein AtMg00810-like [Vigna umbellata]